MQLIVALLLALAAGLSGGFLAGWQFGKADCAAVTAQRTTVGAIARERVRSNDAQQVAKLAAADTARTAHFEGVRRELEQKLQGGGAERECLPADVLRVVNEGRAGGVPAAGPGADAGVPAVAPVAGRQGGDDRPGAGR